MDIKPLKSDYSPVLILGMHRSGTSCLTGCLEEAGLYLGEVNQKAGFNKKGNRENRAVMELHDAILLRHNAAWDQPPSGRVVHNEADQKTLLSILDDYPQSQPIGFKDPRSLFCLSLWKAATRPRFIGTFRHPLEVAGSLMRRAAVWKQDMPLDKALMLWQAYNQAMLAEYAKTPFPIIRYDVAPDIYLSKLCSVMPQLGLTEARDIGFREDQLKTQSQTADVPDHLSFIWDTLNTLAV